MNLELLKTLGIICLVGLCAEYFEELATVILILFIIGVLAGRI